MILKESYLFQVGIVALSMVSWVIKHFWEKWLIALRQKYLVALKVLNLC